METHACPSEPLREPKRTPLLQILHSSGFVKYQAPIPVSGDEIFLFLLTKHQREPPLIFRLSQYTRTNWQIDSERGALKRTQ